MAFNWVSIAAEPDFFCSTNPLPDSPLRKQHVPADLIRNLNASGMTVIVIEHDMGFIRSLRARTSVLHYGQLFAQVEFDEIAANEDVRRIYLGAA